MNRRQWLMGAAAGLARGGSHEPLRIGLVGLVHGHVKGLLRLLAKRSDVRLVGIAEANQPVAERYRKEYGLEESLFHRQLDAMLDQKRPEGVLIFTNTFDHRQVVEACAARRLPCMMEKPLAVSREHGRAIAEAARKAHIPVLVNYETTWYANNQIVERVAKQERQLGTVRRIVVRDGHNGPKEIGVEPEFLDFLTDPKRNGAGALYDFGCYGANLITWLFDNQRPLSVTAVTQRLKPEIYRQVDDEATILLTYPHAVGIIEASWNWPYSRKDMEIYGERGYLQTIRSESVRLRVGSAAEETLRADPLPEPYGDYLSYFTAVVRQRIQPTGLSALENNVLVNEILDAARRSAATGRRVLLKAA